MKRVFMFVFAVVLASTWIGTAGAAVYKVDLKLASTQSMDHPYMIGAQKFADLMKEDQRAHHGQALSQQPVGQG
jgi:TRAP-type C4-dicarboxylate transport system substrate-binding protein